MNENRMYDENEVMNIVRIVGNMQLVQKQRMIMETYHFTGEELEVVRRNAEETIREFYELPESLQRNIAERYKIDVTKLEGVTL